MNRTFFIYLLLTSFLTHSIFAQKLSVEELIVLNKKSELQISGILQRQHWKYHHATNYFSEVKNQSLYSKQTSEHPVSLEFLKFNYIHLLHDTYIELIVIDSVRYQELVGEVTTKFKVQKDSLNINDEALEVYANKEHTFIFKKKYTEKLKLYRYHFFLYNTETYQTLKRKMEYRNFWSEE